MAHFRDELFKGDVDGEAVVPGKQGAPCKPWDELGTRQKRAKNQKAFDEVKKLAASRNVEPEKVVGGLLRR